jgi:hypothetical protein
VRRQPLSDAGLLADSGAVENAKVKAAKPITVTGLGRVTFRQNRFRDTRLRQRLDRHQTFHGQTGRLAASPRRASCAPSRRRP